MNLKLNNGVNIPCIGFGTWKMNDYEVAVESVKSAILCGYRHIDTASIYGNEDAVGEAIKQSHIARDKLFITTKLWNTACSYEEAIEAFNTSLEKLKLDYVDLYLIHWPAPKDCRSFYQKRNIEIYRAMEKLYKDGKIKAIGVSNFLKHHLEELSSQIEIPIMVNQIEFHPYYYDEETIAYCQKHNIVLEAYSPLGRGQVLNDPIIKRIANKYNKTPAQICIHYAIDNEIIPLPKSITIERIKSNHEVFDFQLTAKDIQEIKNLSHDHGKIGSHPDMADF